MTGIPIIDVAMMNEMMMAMVGYVCDYDCDQDHAAADDDSGAGDGAVDDVTST